MKALKLVHGFVLASLAFSLVEIVDVPRANAVVGRPLTPVSVAGVARRTTRRCAAGVYNCQLTPPAQEKPGLTVRDRSTASAVAMSTVTASPSSREPRSPDRDRASR
jgi:hypothetical protein